MGSDLIVYRASELGGCMKANVAKQLGYDQLENLDDFATLFREGDLHEQDVLMQLEADGARISAQQRLVTLQITDNVVVEGHLDAEIEDDTYSDVRVLEIKSKGDEQFKDFVKHRWDTPGLTQRYKWQISVYMIATGHEALVVFKNRNNGQIHREGVEIPFYSREQIIERVMEIEDWRTKSVLPPGCDTINYPCPFYYLHEPEEVSETDEVLERVARDYKDAQAHEKRAKENTGNQRKELERILGTRNKYVSEQVKITKYIQSYTKLDSEKMRADGINVEAYQVKDTSDRLRVTIKEDKGEKEE